MAYCTNLQFAERSGLGIKVYDENVGTGDNSNAYFDLDYNNIVSGSYTLNYATSGSNQFTALTETTHYTLDADSGRITLTAAGITLLATKVLYATYTYINDFKDSVITDLITSADLEINFLTKRNWTTATSTTEYHDGRKTMGYPMTDRPYETDWDKPDFIVLNNHPVTKIDQAMFLLDPEEVALFYNYDADVATYTDKTDNVNDSTEAPFTLFASTPAIGDIVYIGCEHIFMGMQTNLTTVGTGSPAITWSYYDGSTWSSLTVTETDTGSSTFKASGKFTWAYPYGWTKTSVNSHTYYWIKGTITTAYTIAPILATIALRDIVNKVLEPRELIFDSNGVLTFTDTKITNGTNNIRIDYYYGYSSTPAYITELSILFASLRAYTTLSGGNYDSFQSSNLGSKSITIGDKPARIDTVVSQIRKRIDEILGMIGKRCDLAVI